ECERGHPLPRLGLVPFRHGTAGALPSSPKRPRIPTPKDIEMPALLARRSVTVAAVCAAICSTLVARCSVRAVADEPRRPRELQRYVPTAEELRAGYQPPQRPIQSRVPVYKDRITPHWFPDNKRFWYRNDLRGGAKEFILVDAAQGRKQVAFDHGKLATSLSKAMRSEWKADRLPFDEIEFVNDEKAI